MHSFMCALEDDYMNTIYRMSVEELREFEEDNAGIVVNEFIFNHWQYYNFITHLHNLTHSMPLYYYESFPSLPFFPSYEDSKLTRYYSPEPPRAFTTFFKDLPLLWENLLQDISVCFTTPDVTYYQIPRVINYETYNRFLKQATLEGCDYTILKQNAFVACGEIWFASSGKDHPMGLPLSLYLNAIRISSQLKCVGVKEMDYESYNTYHRSDSMIMELLKHMKLLTRFY